MRNNSTCGNSLYLGIYYHFKPKTQKKNFYKKFDKGFALCPLHFFKNHKTIISHERMIQSSKFQKF